MVEISSEVRTELTSLGVDFSIGARAIYAYDASSYRVVPLGVCHPETVDHVRRLMTICAEHSIAVTARGAGTSMAGNAVGDGLVLDFSRSLNRVLELDPVARLATVEPGVVLDDLQKRAARHGLMFAPDPSSHSRATVGGMIGNDACGNHSVRYGRTSDHVVALDLVLADGSRVVAERGGFRPWAPDDALSRDRARILNEDLAALVSRHLAEIRLELGRIPRQVSGYQLHHLLPENGFDVARALVGSEGSCALVVGATVALTQVAPAKVFMVLGYHDIIDAAADVPQILTWSPAAVEGMDESIVDTMRERRGQASVAGLPDGQAWLFVELEGARPDDLQAEAAQRVEELLQEGRLLAGRIVPDPAERLSLWHVRENGAGLATRRSDGVQTWAGWEDSAVGPHDLAAYLAELRALMAIHGLTGAFYGHFGAGCVHVRMDFDLRTPAGVRVMREFVSAAARLVARFGGSISGEHGDGRSRSELLSILYSHEIREAFRGLKSAMDPGGNLNPGMVVDPARLDTGLLQIGSPAPRRPELQFAYTDDRGSLDHAVGRCVGVGRCRSDGSGGMCPSFRATHDEADSTRGRARALQEMLRGGVVEGGWRSAAVRDSLDLCLSCKACSTECPVGVDMATYKSEFLHHHYRRRLRPRTHYSLGWLPVLASLVGRAPWLANGPLRVAPLRHLLAFLGGVTGEREVPRFHRGSAAWGGVHQNLDNTPAFPVVLFTDTFTTAFRPHLVGAAVRSLNAAGVRAQSCQGACCGLTWISTGQLARAKRVLRRTVQVLDDTGDALIVVLEPSCADVLSKDAPALLGSDAARRVARRVRTYVEMMDERLEAGWSPPVVGGSAALQVHCHETAAGGEPTQLRVLRRLGVRDVVTAEGCCGLAGNFGFERQHFDTSLAIAELSLVPTLASPAAGAVILADGFSCQTQILHVAPEAATRPVHLAELIDSALARTEGDT